MCFLKINFIEHVSCANTGKVGIMHMRVRGIDCVSVSTIRKTIREILEKVTAIKIKLMFITCRYTQQ
jgi:hypothetical protein